MKQLNIVIILLFKLQHIKNKLDFLKGAANLPSHKESMIMEGQYEEIITEEAN